jgi:hypothetical protein
MGTFLKNRILQSGSTAIVLPHGTTANRPSNPVFGAFRYNTSTGTLEFFNGSIYKTVASTGEANITVDSFTGDNSTLTFTLSTTVSAADQTFINSQQVFILSQVVALILLFLPLL